MSLKIPEATAHVRHEDLFAGMTNILEGDQKIISEMLALFASIDGQTNEFAAKTGLKCKSGCGHCCTNPDIETTVAEVLPLAAYLSSQNLAKDKWEAIQAAGGQGTCIFYQPDAHNKDSGKCGIYAYRPGICRLFGFAARKDKYGRSVLVTCKVIKDGQPQDCEKTQRALEQGGVKAPLLNEHAFAVSNIDPVRGQRYLAINQAIALAIERVEMGKTMVDEPSTKGV